MSAAGSAGGCPNGCAGRDTHRTPGYHAWQQPHWLYHCDDGAAYLGRVGWDQIQDDVGALQALHLEASELGLDDSQTRDWIGRLTVDGDLTAYLFECLHCGVRLAYSDVS